MIAETWQEALEKWDNGETVFTIEMGGLGPGYDHAINVTVFDLLRHQKEHGCLKKEGQKWPKCWHEVTYKESPEMGGLSGAQAGAAMNLACNYVLVGYKEIIQDPKLKDRLIQDKKEFP